MDSCGVTGRGVLARAVAGDAVQARGANQRSAALHCAGDASRDTELNAKMRAGTSSGCMPKQARLHLHGRALRPAARPNSALARLGHVCHEGRRRTLAGPEAGERWPGICREDWPRKNMNRAPLVQSE